MERLTTAPTDGPGGATVVLVEDQPTPEAAADALRGGDWALVVMDASWLEPAVVQALEAGRESGSAPPVVLSAPSDRRGGEAPPVEVVRRTLAPHAQDGELTFTVEELI